MDNLNVRISNGKRGDEIDSMLIDKINECRLNVAGKALGLAKDYIKSDTDGKNLIAYRVCALKCDVPEIMDFVRKFNQDLANRVDQVDIENRISEVEHSKNIKEGADIGLNSAGDTNDKDAEKEKRIRNAAAKKVGDMLSKTDWANIKFEEEVSKFKKLDPETIRQAIKSGKINGLNLVFLHYVLYKMDECRFTERLNEQHAQAFCARELKMKVQQMKKLLPLLEKFFKGVRAIRIKNGDLSEDGHHSEYYRDERYVGKTDHERDVEKKAKELYEKAIALRNDISKINKHFAFIGRRTDENGTVRVPKDICGFFKKIEEMDSIRRPEKVLIIPNDPGNGHLISITDAISTLDKEICGRMNEDPLILVEPLKCFSKNRKEFEKETAHIAEMLGR